MSRLHVIGAGPSGSVAAITAARNGHNVILSEEHSTAGIPQNCSGLFSEQGLIGLKDYVDYRKFSINRVSGVKIFFGNEVFSVKAPRTMGHVCSRAEFDRELTSVAEREGVKVEYNKRVNGNFHSENIIGADGPFSHVAEHFRFPRIGRFVLTMQAMVDYRSEGKDFVEVHLSSSKYPGFFGWVIPHDEDKAEFGVGVGIPNDVKAAWNAFLKIMGVEKTGKVSAAIIPAETRLRSAVSRGKRKVLLVGDAAGQVKATSGGGVIFGTSCARLAGKFFRSPARYELEWRLRYGADLGVHRLIRDSLDYCSDRKLELLGRKLKSMKMDEYLENYGDMDRPLLMLRPEMLLHTLKTVITNG